MNKYADLLKTPGVARIIAAQLTARLPSGMISLAYLLHIEQIFNSYGLAGLVLAATSLGQALAGPLTSRWMGYWAMRPVIILTIVVSAFAMAGIAFVSMPIGAYIAVGFVGGLATPPVQPAVRTIYPTMVTSKQLTPLFSLDASAQEIIWIAGPVVTTFIATQISTQLAIIVAGAFLILGGLWFLSCRELGEVKIPRSKSKMGAVLAKPPVVLATVVGFLLIGSAAAVEVAVVSVFGHGGPEAGIILSIWAVGSIIGGLALGGLAIGPWALAARMFVVFVGIALAGAVLDFWWIALALLIAGAGIAPALAVMFAIVSSSVKFSETAEAYGWMGSGQLVGAALGSAVAGFAIDGFGSLGGFVAASIFALLGFLVPTIFRSAHPDLRGKDMSPHPDTEPVQIIKRSRD
ncbi:MAG: MFS transporter [Actinomycetota bacterium]|nr:MFS transporter [Actinomycetota bacterium]MDA3002781.1 MFS transporter [Actinomycetota bacterium]